MPDWINKWKKKSAISNLVSQVSRCGRFPSWMNLWKYSAGLLVVLILAGCGKSLPSLDGVDLTKWKDDKGGCNGFRKEVNEYIIKQKDKLLSLSETDIVRLLGKPDETELYKRNEKFYKYYFSNGPGCSDNEERKFITLRFNAVGLLKEVVPN